MGLSRVCAARESRVLTANCISQGHSTDIRTDTQQQEPGTAGSLLRAGWDHCRAGLWLGEAAVRRKREERILQAYAQYPLKLGFRSGKFGQTRKVRFLDPLSEY